MRNTFKYIVTLAALLLGASLFAQTSKYTEEELNSLKTSKVVTPNGDGTYKITLDTYVEGEGGNRVIHSVTPLDVVLVLDVSGSMSENFGTTTYRPTEYTKDTPLSSFFGWYQFIFSSNQTNSNYYVKYNGEYYNLTIRGHRESLIPFRLSYSASFTDSNGTVHSNLNDLTDDIRFYRQRQTKMAALQSAAELFIQSVTANAAVTGAEHRISLVKFASDKTTTIGDDMVGRYNYSQIVKDFKVVTSDSQTDGGSVELMEAVNNLTAAGATSSDYGMELASSQLNKVKREDVKVVVMFTDGEPNHQSGFDDAVANGAIKAASDLKNLGAIVYTVGVFDNETANIKKYMSYVSSNNDKNVTGMTSTGTLEGDYYFRADNADELDNVFERIAKDITEKVGNGAGIEFKETDDVTLKDIVTPSFVLPAGKNSIKVFEVPVKEDRSSGILEWAFDETTKKDVTKTYTVAFDESTNAISVSGFNYSDHWCGLIKHYENKSEVEDPTKRKINESGAKLTIEITVEPNEDYEGGVMKTNDDENSGIFVNGQPTSPIKEFENPDNLLFFNDIDLVITRSGLKTGESTVYNVVGTNGFKIDVPVSASTGDTGSTTIRVKVKDGDQFITYTVTEDTDWAWAHGETKAMPQEKILVNLDSDNVPVSNNNKFVFEANANEVSGTIAHDEKFNTVNL